MSVQHYPSGHRKRPAAVPPLDLSTIRPDLALERRMQHSRVTGAARHALARREVRPPGYLAPTASLSRRYGAESGRKALPHKKQAKLSRHVRVLRNPHAQEEERVAKRPPWRRISANGGYFGDELVNRAARRQGLYGASFDEPYADGRRKPFRDRWEPDREREWTPTLGHGRYHFSQESRHLFRELRRFEAMYRPRYEFEEEVEGEKDASEGAEEGKNASVASAASVESL